MKNIYRVTIFMVLLTLFTGVADAQKKTTKKATDKKASAVTVVPPLAVRAAREKVDTQLFNVNRFVNALGPIAQGIETLEETARVKPLPKKTADMNEVNKQDVLVAIRGMKDGLAVLESEFRTTPALQKYLPYIQGITDLAASSEDSAIAGKYVAAKEPFRGIAMKLTDTLATMPR